MKKLLLFVSLLFCVTINSNAQTDMKVCAYFDGFWSDWESAEKTGIRGNYDEFIIYRQKDGPWEYGFKLKIDNMSFPDKGQREKDLKANKWYRFSGKVEYYIDYFNPSALEMFREHKGPRLIGATGCDNKKITSRAIIKIAPFIDYPKVYTIFYDSVGLGIDLGTTRFPVELPSED